MWYNILDGDDVMLRRLRLLFYILTPFVVWIGGSSYQIYMSYQFGELNSDVNANEVNLVINLEVVEEISEEKIVLFDEMKHLVFIYDYNGNLINKFKFHHSGSVIVIDYENDNLTVFYWRTYTYYVVNDQGIIIDAYEGDSPEHIPDTLKCIDNEVKVCSENYFLYNEISIDGENTFISYSFIPFMVLVASCLAFAVRLNKKIQMEEAEETF